MKMIWKESLKLFVRRNGYYKDYQIEPFNMKHGALLIRKNLKMTNGEIPKYILISLPPLLQQKPILK